MQIRAFSIEKPAKCYVTCLPLLDILDRMKVDEWGVDNKFGYQRPLDSRRFGKGNLSITKYIENGYSTSSNIIASTREILGFKEDYNQGGLSSGYLDIPDYVNFWIIDGRHKLEAYRRLLQNNVDQTAVVLGITIYDAVDVGFETGLFYILNTSSLSLASGIKYRNIQNLGRHFGEKYLLENFDLNTVMLYRAIELVDIINDRDDSPFFRRICVFGEKLDKKHFVKDVELVPMFQKMFETKILESNFDELLFDYLTFWNVLTKMYPECYEDNAKYALFGYPGLFIFNKLFLDVEKRVSDSSEASYRKILFKLNSITEKHPQLVFRNAMGSSHWDVTVNGNIFITKNPQILNFIYNHLKHKLDL